MQHVHIFENYSRQTFVRQLQERPEQQKFVEFFHTYKELKMSGEDIDQLIKLDRDFDRVRELRKTSYMKEILNLDEERDKFFAALEKGEVYNPVFKHHAQPYDQNHMVERAQALIKKFQDLDCFLSPYYIEKLEFLVTFGKIKKMDPDSPAYGRAMLDLYGGRVNPVLVAEAERILAKNPYQKRKGSSTDISAREMVKIVRDELKNLGYSKWKVVVYDNMIPRMGVKDAYEVKINADASFSKADIPGLLAHELAGHVGRRFYGDQTGLFLFRSGLPGKNQFDEGLAIYKSLQVKTAKPNVLFNIALFTVLASRCHEMTFYELFQFGKRYLPKDDKKMFSKVMRIKKICHDTSMLTGDLEEQEYLAGYLLVSKMSDAQREEILKYNIGPEQFGELDRIKAFLKLNHFGEGGSK
jgi:hypothetical protein